MEIKSADSFLYFRECQHDSLRRLTGVLEAFYQCSECRAVVVFHGQVCVRLDVKVIAGLAELLSDDVERIRADAKRNGWSLL